MFTFLSSKGSAKNCGTNIGYPLLCQLCIWWWTCQLARSIQRLFSKLVVPSALLSFILLVPPHVLCSKQTLKALIWQDEGYNLHHHKQILLPLRQSSQRFCSNRCYLSFCSKDVQSFHAPSSVLFPCWIHGTHQCHVISCSIIPARTREYNIL